MKGDIGQATGVLFVCYGYSEISLFMCCKSQPFQDVFQIEKLHQHNRKLQPMRKTFAWPEQSLHRRIIRDCQKSYPCLILEYFHASNVEKIFVLWTLCPYKLVLLCQQLISIYSILFYSTLFYFIIHFKAGPIGSGCITIARE